MERKITKKARTALKDACSALDRYANEASAQHVQDAKDLSKAISSYSQNIAQNHSGAANKIDGWWREVDNWFTKRAQSWVGDKKGRVSAGTRPWIHELIQSRIAR